VNTDGGSRVSRHEAEQASDGGVASGESDMPCQSWTKTARRDVELANMSSEPLLGVVTPGSTAAAVGLVAVALCGGWLIMWIVILRKIPIVRVMCDLPELSPKSDKSD
jgi:hypothetical protein